jgi:hypothetical protein
VTVTSVPRVGVTSAETIQYVSTAPGSPLGVGFGPAGWSADSNTLFVGIGGSGQVALRTDGPNGPSIRSADIDKSAVQVRLGTVAGVGTQTVLVRSNTLLPARAASLSHAASVLKSALRANGQEYSESWALSPDGARVATIVGSDLWLVAVQDGAITRVPVGEAGHVSFTSTKLCVARYQGPIDVRDPVSGTLLKTIPGDQADSGIIASGRDSNILARIRLDGLIELIDVEQGQLIGTVGKQGTIQYGMVPGLLITPGGSELFVVYPYSPEVARSGEVQELKASPESWIRAACQSVGRNLTAAEWHASMGDVEPENLDCR